MMFEFESFVAFCAFKFPQNSAFVVADHVALEAVDICEGFVANFA